MPPRSAARSAAPAVALPAPAADDDYDSGDEDASDELLEGLSTVGRGLARAGRGAGALAAGGAVHAAGASARAAVGLTRGVARVATPALAQAGRVSARHAAQAGRTLHRLGRLAARQAQAGSLAALQLAGEGAARLDPLSVAVTAGAGAIWWLMHRGSRDQRSLLARSLADPAPAHDDADGPAQDEAAAAAAAATAAAVEAAHAAALGLVTADGADGDAAAAAARARVNTHVLRAAACHVASLERAGRPAEARALLLALDWQRLLIGAGGLSHLLRELARRSVHDRPLAALAALLRRAAPALRCERGGDAWPAQLLGRLGRSGPGVPTLPAELTGLLREAAAWRAGCPWLRPLQPSLDGPGSAVELSLEGHTEAVTSVALLPQGGGRLATGSRDGTVRVWDPQLGACCAALGGHSGGVSALAALLPQGQLASGSLDGTLRLWSAETCAGAAPATPERTLATGPVRALASIGDSGRLAVGTDAADVAIWHASRGVLEARLAGHSDRVIALAALPDGVRIASAAADGELRLWHCARRACVAVIAAGRLTYLAALGRGRIAAASPEGVRVWDLDAMDPEDMAAAAAAGRAPPPLFALGCGKVNAVCGAGDGRIITGSDSCLRTWAAAADVYGPAAAAHHAAVAAAGGAPGGCVRTLRGRHAATTAVAALPDGRLAQGGADGTVRLWSGVDGGAARAGAGDGSAASIAAASSHDSRVTAVAALPFGRAASASWDFTIRLWDADGRCERVLSGHAARVSCLVVTDDGSLLVSAADAALRVWGANDGGCRRVMDAAHARAISCLIALPGGRVASGGEDAVAKVWAAATGDMLLSLAGHSERVTCLADAGGGEALLSGSADRTARLWCLRTGAKLAVLEAHTEALAACAAMPRCRLLLTAGDDKTVRVWAPDSDADDGSWCVAHTLKGHPDALRALLPLDDFRFASVGVKDSMRVWHGLSGTMEGSHRASLAAPLPRGDAPPGHAAPPMLLAAGAHVGASFGVAGAYVDDAVRCLVVLSPADANADGTRRRTVAVAATDAGGVHFLQLCPPAPPAR